jgi:hypothetical protein
MIVLFLFLIDSTIEEDTFLEGRMNESPFAASGASPNESINQHTSRSKQPVKQQAGHDCHYYTLSHSNQQPQTDTLQQ